MKIVYIEWVDSNGIERHNSGSVIKETEEYITLGHPLSESGFLYDTIKTPKMNIKSEKVLSKGSQSK